MRVTAGSQSQAATVNTEGGDIVEAFATAQKFRRLPDDDVAANPAVRFRVETFEAVGRLSAAQALSVPPQMARSGWQRAEQALADKGRDGDRRALAWPGDAGARSTGNAERSPCPAAPRTQTVRTSRPARLRTRPRLTRKQTPLGGGRHRRRRGPPPRGELKGPRRRRLRKADPHQQGRAENQQRPAKRRSNSPNPPLMR
jgi:hypothetical protein